MADWRAMGSATASALRLLVTLLSSTMVTWSKSTERVLMPSSYCDGPVIEVDAVYLYSGPDELRGKCTIRLEADLDHFMVGFSHMKLSCGQHLKLYYGSDDSGKPNKVFDCRTQKYEVRDFLFEVGRHLTVTFEKPLGQQTYNFTLVITSYESSFLCDFDQLDCMYNDREICVDDDLQCDGIRNCPDNKDESLCSFSVDEKAMSSVAVGIVITIVVLCILTCASCIAGVVYCCWRRHQIQGTVIGQQHIMTQQSVQSAAGTSLAYYPATSQQPGTPLAEVLPAGYQQAPAVGFGGYPPVPVTPSGGYPQAPVTPSGGYPQAPVTPSGGYQLSATPTASTPLVHGTPTSPQAVLFPPAPYNPDFEDPQMQSPPPYTAQPVIGTLPVNETEKT